MHGSVTTSAIIPWPRAALLLSALKSLCRKLGSTIAIIIAVLAGLSNASSLSPFVASAAAQEGEPTIMIVLDGSGSMWGRIDGTSSSKLRLVREELMKVLRSRGGKTNVGLTTFGSQSGNSCSSSQTPLAPAPDTVDELQSLLDRFNPQGRGPVVLGLRTAMQAISSEKGPVRLLLIHDSPDNCGEDLCAMAQEFAKSNPGVPVDVLSVALKPEDAGAMQCLTKATGGRLIEAEDAPGVTEGLQELIGNVATGTSSNSATDGSVAKPGTSSQSAALSGPDGNAKPPSAKPIAKEAGVVLSARLAQTNTPIARGVSWLIKRMEPKAPAIEKTLDAATTRAALTPGRYLIVLQASNTSIKKTVTITEGVMEQTDFVFDGGMLEITGDGFAEAENQQVVPTELVHIVGLSSTEQGTQVAWSGARADINGLLLKSGRYEVTISSGFGQQSQFVDIATGTISKVNFANRLGRLVAVATDLSPTQLTDARIAIAADDPKAPGGRRAIAVTTSPKATFDLPAGPYYISLSAFGSTATELVVLAAGQTVTHALHLKQMALQVTSYIGEAEKPADGDVRYRLWRAGQLDRPLEVRRKSEPVFHLTPGKYRLESSIGQQNVTMIREFDVGTAPQGRLELRHEAGRVSFSLPGGSPDLRDNNAYWQFFDQDGRRIWRTFHASPKVLLLAGAYSATVSVKNTTYEAKFVVVAGQTQTVMLGTN